MSIGLAVWAARWARPPCETAALTDPRRVFWKWALALAVVIAALAFFVLPAAEILRWNSLRVDVPTSGIPWSAFYGPSPKPCGPDARPGDGCLGDPAVSGLWESPDRRASGAHRSRVATLAGREYWIGKILPVPLLRQASRLGANVLALGRIRGSYRIFIEGQEVWKASFRDRAEILLPLPAGWLAAGRPLHVAVEIVHDSGILGVPDLLATYFDEGLATPSHAEAYRKSHVFRDIARPLALATAHLILAAIFLLAWHSSPEKQERLCIGLYAVSAALVHMKNWETLGAAMTLPAFSALSAASALVYAVMPAFVGFSFARLRRSVFTAGLGLLAMAVAAVAVAAYAQVVPHVLAQRLFFGWATPLCAALGSLACLAQASLIGAQPALKLGGRRVRLFHFAGALGAIALSAACFDADYTIKGPSQVLFSRVGQFFAIGYMAWIVLREYREERSLIEKSPLTPYHRATPLPEAVSGILLLLDMKDSERLYRLGARLGRAGELVNHCLHMIWTGVHSSGGTVLGTEGDSIIALFDSALHAEPARAALEACVRAKAMLGSYEHRLAQFTGGDGHLPLELRGSVACGLVRPVWHEIGGLRLPGWIETGDSNVFVEAARMLELERQVPARTCRTNIMIPPDLLPPGELPGGWTRTGPLRLAGKHGVSYDICAVTAGLAKYSQ